MQERYRLETEFGVLASLSQVKEGNRTKDNGTRRNAQGLGFIEFLDRLIKIKFELGLIRKLRDYIVVV